MLSQPLDINALLGKPETGPVFPDLNLEPLFAAIAPQMPLPADVSGVSKAITDALEQALAINVGDVLANGWSSVGLVKAAQEATKSDPEAMAYVPLDRHQMLANLKPNIDIIQSLAAPLNLAFELDLKLEIKGAQVEIKGGKIIGTQIGSLAAESNLKFSGFSILQRQTPEIALPGRLSFEKPVEQSSGAKSPKDRA